jgi:hypothetical protein
MINLETLVSRITVGKLCPTMTITAMNTINHAGEPSKPGINIEMTVIDAQDQRFDLRLFQWFEVPERLLTGDDERALVEWVFDRVKDVLVHELEEFFRFDNEMLRQPKHPLPG